MLDPPVDPLGGSWECADESELDWTLTPEQCAVLDRRLDDPDPGRRVDEVLEEIRRELLARRRT